MKSFILILIVVLNTQFFSQQQIPDLVIPITVTFDIPPYPPPYVGEFLEIGLDSTATDGLDEHLGEFDLPPVPPPGWPAYFWIPTNNTTYNVQKDFRFGVTPYTGEVTHTLRFLGAYGATIHWNIPEGIYGILKDAITGNLISEVMVGQDSFYVSYNFINELYITIHYSEPIPLVQILHEITVSDGGFPPKQLYFGLSEAATDSIDILLGESELPPFPPLGFLEARFFLPENNFSGSLSSYSDFRYAVIPFTGQKEWRVAYQTTYGNTINISWDFPSYMTGVLQDIINGTFINVPMTDSGSYTVQDPYVFDRLRMIIDFDIEVPVELISFTAEFFENKNEVKLNWSTATETNNSGFTIERSQTESEWTEIGFVPGFGTTTEPKSYSFFDENVTIRQAGSSTGIYKYRLKQIDFDGSFEYSNEIEVEVDFTPEEFVLYQNYPNPFNPNTVISYQLPVTGNVTLKVYDILGNEVATLVNEEKQPGVYEVEFDSHSDEGQNLSSGIYFYQLKAGSLIQTKKMILLK